MAMELRLKYKDLTWLGQAFENSTIISPFTLIKEKGVNEEDKNRLIGLGVIDKENNIKSDYFLMLETLSKADGFIETNFKRGPVEAKKFIMTSNDKKLSLAYTKDEAIINMPANPSGMAEYLKEFMGSSKLTGGDLSLEADAKEVYVLAVVCDLYKKAVLKAYSEEEVFVYKGFTKEELLQSVNTIRENSQSLGYQIFALNNGFEEFEMDKLENIIKSLEEKELLKVDGNIYYPKGEALLLAGNFLIIENMIEIIVGQVKEDKLFRSSFKMLQAGPLDVLYLEKSGQNIIMECMSALNAVNFISTVLSENPSI